VERLLDYAWPEQVDCLALLGRLGCMSSRARLGDGQSIRADTLTVLDTG
jgi:hypothetical protein